MGKPYGDAMDVNAATSRVGENFKIPMEPNDYLNFSDNKQTRGILVQRAYAEYFPQGAGTYLPNQRMNFVVPASNWVNFNSMFLEFQVLIVNENDNTQRYPGYYPGTAPFSHHWVRMKNNAANMIEEVKIRSGQSAALETITNHNILAKFFQIVSLPKSYVNGLGFILEGMHDENTPKLQFLANKRSKSDQTATQETTFQRGWDATYSKPGYTYFIPIQSVLTSLGKYIPVAFTGAFEFEILLAPKDSVLMYSLGTPTRASVTNTHQSNTTLANTLVRADHTDNNEGITLADMQSGIVRRNAFNTTPVNESSSLQIYLHDYTYMINAPRLWIETINPVDAYNSKMKSVMESGSMVKIPGNAFRVQKKYINVLSNGFRTDSFNEKVGNLKAVFWTWINHGPSAETWGSPLLENGFTHNGLSRFRIKIAEEYNPINEVDCSDSKWLLKYLMEALGISENVESSFWFDMEREYRPTNVDIATNDMGWHRYPFKAPHSSKFWAGYSFETSPGQLSGEDLIRSQASLDFQMQFKTDLIGAANVNTRLMTRDTFMLPINGLGYCLYNIFEAAPYLHIGANALTQAVVRPLLDQQLDTPTNASTRYMITATAGQNNTSTTLPIDYFGNVAAYTAEMATGLTLGKNHLHSLMFDNWLEEGWMSPGLICSTEYQGPPRLDAHPGAAYLARYRRMFSFQGDGAPAGTAANMGHVDQSFDIVDLRVNRPEPTGTDMILVTMFSISYILENFNTVSLTTDPMLNL